MTASPAPSRPDGPASRLQRVALHAWLHRILWSAFAVLFAHTGYRAVHQPMRPEGEDMTAYTDAAFLMRIGRSPYHLADQFRELREQGLLLEERMGHGAFQYQYPPLLAWLLQPFSHLPDWVVAGFWFAAQCVLFAWMIRVVLRHAPRRDPLQAAMPAVVLALLVTLPMFRPMQSTLQNSQVNVFCFAAAFAYLCEVQRGNSLRGGLWLALGISLKITPGILLLHALVRRDLRALFAATLGVGALALLPATTCGWQGNLALWDEFLELSAAIRDDRGAITLDPRQNPIYFSYWGFLAWLDPSLMKSRAAELSGIALTAVTAASAHLLLRRAGNRDNGDVGSNGVLAGTIYLACIPLFSPAAQKHHLTSLLPAIVLGTSIAFGKVQHIAKPGAWLWCVITACLWLAKPLPTWPLYFGAVLLTVCFATQAGARNAPCRKRLPAHESVGTT